MSPLRILAPRLASGLALALGLGIASGWGPGRAGQDEADLGAPQREGPGPVAADDFRPAVPGEPRRGGRVTVHLETRLSGLNNVVQSSAPARRVLEEVHARLLERNLETWELEPSLARSVDVHDVVVPADGGARLVGRAALGGDEVVLEPAPRPGLPSPGAVRLPRADVERVEREAAYTFHLREDVRWHDGHPFDARDVVFTLEAYRSRDVQSDHARFRFERLSSIEELDAHTVRVAYDRWQFLGLDSFEDDFVVLPSHLYDLSDPDNPDFDPTATPARRGAWVNENPHNQAWVGLGPYRVVAFGDQAIDAVRFEGYFDRARAGWVDAVRWRVVADDAAARQALLAGEFDFFTRLRSRDYLGELCADPAFTARYDKGWYYTPQMSYVAWNLRRPPFDDVRVRRALGHAFDWDEFIRTIGSGIGRRVTAAWYRFSPAYDPELAPMPYDLERAEELLLEAGFIDRDGDGLLDRDGRPFRFTYLYAQVDAVSRLVGETLKQDLERLGIEMELVARDFAARQELVRARDFDAAGMSWILGPEVDPLSLWHSSQADVQGSNNQAGYADPRSDELIDAIRAERDPARRNRLFHELQRRVHDAQPYLFGCLFPTKFAVSKRVRGVQRFLLDPGYSIRDWWVLDGDPGER